MKKPVYILCKGAVGIGIFEIINFLVNIMQNVEKLPINNNNPESLGISSSSEEKAIRK